MKAPLRHIRVGNWLDDANLCGAPKRSWPERYLATEQYLREVKACPKCNALGAEMDPPIRIRGFDELSTEEAVRMPIVREERVVVHNTLYLRDYLNSSL